MQKQNIKDNYRSQINYKFSILMSVYFREQPKYLNRSLLSILNNSLLPSEIVLVKDGPLTPDLDSIISYFVQNYPSLFKVIVLEENSGLGKALYIGLQKCSFDIVVRMDTDDIASKDRFEKQIQFMLTYPEISVLGGAIAEFDDDSNIIHSYRTPPCSNKELSQYLKYRCPFNHMTVMFRKQDVLAVGSYQDFFFQEDYYLWLRMYLAGYKFANLPDVLVKAQAGHDMLSRRGGSRYVKSEKKLLKFMLENKIINIFEYLILVVSKTGVRLMSPKLRGIVYKLFLRNKSNLK